ncbi:MAG: dihydrofolate reductase family protein [Paludibacter sp.]|nr:dihydrofolate reductase family protein [Paludibacter sp.]
MGGGELISMLLAANLIDEMQICYIPVILSEGIPLFPNKPKESKWKLMGSTAYDSSILKVDYQAML